MFPWATRRRAGAAPFVGILDQMTSTTARAIVNINTKLRAGYTGDAFILRNGTTAAESGIPFKADGTVDLDVLAEACKVAGSFVNCYMKRPHDQSVNGYDFTQSTTGRQSQISTTGGLITRGVAGLLAAKFDGVDDIYERTDNLGLTGDIALALTFFGSAATPLDAECVPVLIGGQASGGLAIFYDDGTDSIDATYIDLHRRYAASGAHVTLSTFQHNMIVRAASQQLQNVAGYTNGSALTPTGTNETATMTLTGTNPGTAWMGAGQHLPQGGAALGFYVDGYSSHFGVFTTPPAGADLTLWNAHAAARI